MKKTTVLLADDHAVLREGIRVLLAATDDIDVIGEAENGHRAVGEARKLQPDVVLMDISMPLLNGVEATRRITKELPATKILILSTYGDDQHVQHAMDAGAAGYITKETVSKDLLQAIREVRNGNPFFSQPIARRFFKQRQNRDVQAKSASASALTSRQTEVVQLIAEGHSSRRIACLLSVSVKTVEKHRQDAMNKLDIHEIATLTRYAVASGIVQPHFAPLAQPAVMAD